MGSRRKFLKSALATGGSLPFLSHTLYNQDSINKTRIPSDSSSLGDDEYWKMVRNLFPIPKDETYFNTGTLGVQATPTLEKTIDYMRKCAVDAAKTDYKGEGPLLLSGYEAYVDLRTKIGGIINCDYRELCLTQNATFGMNYISNGLVLEKGDEIVQTNQEHGGGRAGWQEAARRHGLVYKEFEMPVPANDPDEIIERLFSVVTKKTRVIAVPHIISVYGVVMPVKEICTKAKEMGIFTILDGAQCVGQIPVDVKDIGCDAYFSSLHKWLLAPPGSGILYISEEHIKDIGTTIASYQFENNEDPGFRFTQRGTGNPATMVGLETAVDLFNEIGAEKWLSRVKYLGDHLRNGLVEIDGVEIFSPTHPEMCAGLTTYGIEGIKGPAIQKEMWNRKKLQPRSVGNMGIRHSTHIYNSVEEIDESLEIVKDLAG